MGSGKEEKQEVKRSLKREVDEMGDLESPGGPPVPEAGGRNSEFSRSQLGVGVQPGWSSPSSGKKRSRSTGARSPDASTIRTGGRFTNTAVPKDKWMGGRDGGATVICASGGEALNVALLMPEGERANREGLSQGLSNYNYSPGRLAVFRRKFESVTRRTGADPATFTTDWRF